MGKVQKEVKKVVDAANVYKTEAIEILEEFHKKIDTLIDKHPEGGNEVDIESAILLGELAADIESAKSKLEKVVSKTSLPPESVSLATHSILMEIATFHANMLVEIAQKISRL